MKRYLFFILLFTIFCRFEMSSAADVTIQTGFHYDGWEDTKDNEGRQAYIPIKIEARYEDFSLTLLTGQAYTHFSGIPTTVPSLSENENRSLTHFLDTKLSLSYEIFGKLPVDLLLGLDFNLPTGKTDLNVKDLALIMDPDLVSITNFGEGFDVNPTLSAAKEWGNWVAGIGVGYAWRGKYDFGVIQETSFFSRRVKAYDPGDIFNLTAEIRYHFSPHWNARLFGQYTWYGKEDWNVEDFFKFSQFAEVTKDSYQEGPLYLLGLGLYHNQRTWDAGATLRSIYRKRSKFQTPDLGSGSHLSKEEENSHGVEWVGDLFARYFLDEKTTLNSHLQGLFITKNGYDAHPMFFTSQNRFVSQREKVSLGLGANRKFSSHLEGDVNIKGFLMHDDEARFPVIRSERTYRGYSVGMLLTYRF